MYATVQDMVDTFGLTEITQLAQSITGLRSVPLSDATNTLAVTRALADADNEIDIELVGCVDVAAVKQLYTAGGSIPAFNHFAKDIARYHLYTCIWLGTENNGKDHEAYRRYADALEHIRLLCKKGALIDNNGNLVAATSNILVACRPQYSNIKICCTCGCDLSAGLCGCS